MVKNLYQYRIPSQHCEIREGLILQYDSGWGEIAPLPGWSKETLLDAKKEILAFLFENKKPTLPSVKFGLSCAMCPFDFSPIKIPVSALDRPLSLCQTLKLKLKNLTIQQAIDHVKPYVGKYRLRIDCNRAWSLQEALFFANHFSPSHFEYLEEPVHSFFDLVRFSKLTNFPIAVDESLREGLPYLEIPTLKAAIVKPMLMGEIPKLNVPIVLSSSHESSLGILQMARLAAPNISHGFDTFSDDVLTPPLCIKNGYLTWRGYKSPIDVTKLCLIATAP